MLPRPLRFALLSLPPALVCTCARLFPAFSRFWAGAIARPGLRLLSAAGNRLPFPLLEWGALVLGGILAMALLFRLLRRGPLRACALAMKCAARIALALFWLFAALWYHLYFAEPTQQLTATAAQLAASCRALIQNLNDAALDFSQLPEDLPAKFAALPGWMDALNITGFASFFTGEALISPELPGAAVPFVAAHEAMHLRGHADEGATNLAAWEDCLRRGGSYAESARLWALKDSLALLRRADPKTWADCRTELSPRLARLLRELGGETSRPSDGAIAAFSLLGVGEAVQSYEILALYLAAGMPV